METRAVQEAASVYPVPLAAFAQLATYKTREKTRQAGAAIIAEVTNIIIRTNKLQQQAAVKLASSSSPRRAFRGVK